MPRRNPSLRRLALRVTLVGCAAQRAALADEECVSEHLVEEELADGDASARGVDVAVSAPLASCGLHPGLAAHVHLSAHDGTRVLVQDAPLLLPPPEECPSQVTAAAELVQAALDARPAPDPLPRIQPWVSAGLGGGVSLGGTGLGAPLDPAARARGEVAGHGRLGGGFAGLLLSADIGGWTQVRAGGRVARVGRSEVGGALVGGRDLAPGAPHLDLGLRAGLRGVWLTETASFRPNTTDGTFRAAAVTPYAGVSLRVWGPRLPVFLEVAAEGVLPARLGDGAALLYAEPPVRGAALFGVQFRAASDHTPAPAR